MSPEFQQVLEIGTVYSIVIFATFVVNVIVVSGLSVGSIYGKVKIRWVYILAFLLCFLSLTLKFHYWGKINEAASAKEDFQWISERDGGATIIPISDFIITILFLLGLSLLVMKVSSWYKNRG